MVNNCAKIIQSLLYPSSCALCGAAGQFDLDLCGPCREELPHNLHCCPRCALPLPSATPAGTTCGRCLQRRLVFERSLCPYLYRPPLDRLISHLKFNGRLVYARLLAELLGDFIARQSPVLPDLLIPVPLYRTRLRQRGFNQALEITRPLARRFDIPLEYRACIRQRATEPQAELERANRQTNVRGAFRVIGELKVQRAAIVDDVVTTGATVSELTRALRGAGVEQMEIWAVARTP